VTRDLRLRAVAFDFDGTLVDSNAAKRQAYFEAARPADPSGGLVAQVLDEHPRGDRHEVMRALAERAAAAGLLGPREVEAAAADLVAAYTAIVEAAQAERPETRGATFALAALAPAIALYVNSATPADSLRRAVARRGWLRHFRDVLGRPADKAANLRSILAREGLPPDEVAMVGDQQCDLEAARVVGCAFVAVASDASDFQDPVALLTDLATLPAALEGLRS
jgi:phosphoglycolate phosphatase-like HAD superfamily hydrolase